MPLPSGGGVCFHSRTWYLPPISVGSAWDLRYLDGGITFDRMGVPCYNTSINIAVGAHLLPLDGLGGKWSRHEGLGAHRVTCSIVLCW